MNCNEFRELVDSYLSDELLTETNHRVLTHIEDCKDCSDETETRQLVRVRLRTAILNCEEFQVDDEFCNRMKVKVSGTQFRGRFFRNTGFIAAAASILIVATIGFWLFAGQQGVIQQVAVNGIGSEAIVNAAVGDHQQCAVKGNRKAHKPLASSNPQYAGFAEVVTPVVKDNLSECEMVSAHACNFEGTEFAHLVFNNEGKMVSILVTDRNSKDERVESATSVFPKGSGFQVAKFETNKHEVIVVSELNNSLNLDLTKGLQVPITKHFQDRFISATTILRW